MNVETSAVDLFCGAGGLTRGLEDAGVSVGAGVDVDPACRFPYDYNNDSRFVCRDIAEKAVDDPGSISELLDSDVDATILAGCAPCQPFSPLNHGGDSSEHEKWGLLDALGRLVEEIQPDLVAMENVYEVRHHDVYERFVETLEDEGYAVNPEEDRRVYCPDFGVPQTRRRWVLLASKLGPIELDRSIETDPEDYQTVRDAIGDLSREKPISAGEVHPRDPLHRARSLSEKNLKRIERSKPGGTWRDWPEGLRLPCHKKDTGRSYDSVYGRMEWDAPAPTITTQFYNYGSGRFGHPEQDRAISLREGALLQSFPDDYRFVEDWDRDGSLKSVARMIGNAVPPRLGEVIGRSLKRHVAGIRQMTLADY